MILLVDNYDSFTYNLAHLFGELGADVVVRRNDAIDADGAERLGPTHLVVSPGPGRPAAAGATRRDPARLAPRVPTLGVCLGHQALAEAFGGEVGPARELVHGKAATVEHDGRGLFTGLPARADRGPLPLARGHPRPGRVRGFRHGRRRRGDGHAPSRPPDRRHPVPPRVGAHPARLGNRT